MNTNENTTYTREQHALIAELAATYGLEPDQIVFFGDDPEPLFDREACAVLIFRLTEASGIDDSLVQSPFPDAIAVHYMITFKDGTFAGSDGAANLNETADGKALTPEQIKSLATGRACRSALRNKGINLLKLHFAAKAKANGNVATPQFSGPPRSERETLLRQVHALGTEAGLIDGDNKTGWYNLLAVRYNVAGSNELTDYLLKDLAAHLNTLPKTQPSNVAA
jgi:hypothetical protein